MHPTTVKALARYRRQRALHVPTKAETPFLIGSRGRRLGQPLGDRQAHRVFNALRDHLGWVNRGAHDAPRLHDLRHTFVVRRLMIWHADGTDVDQMMLALSTYLGHAEIFYTYWYLTAVPELMALAGARFERFVDVGEFDDDGDGTFRTFGPPVQANRGVAVTPTDNHVWVANSGVGTVTRLDNDGDIVKVIGTGVEPTGVAVDAAGKVPILNAPVVVLLTSTPSIKMST